MSLNRICFEIWKNISCIGSLNRYWFVSKDEESNGGKRLPTKEQVNTRGEESENTKEKSVCVMEHCFQGSFRVGVASLFNATTITSKRLKGELLWKIVFRLMKKLWRMLLVEY